MPTLIQEDEPKEQSWNTAKETTDDPLSDSEKNVDFIEKWKVVLKVRIVYHCSIYDRSTPQIVYKVAICPRGILPYI